MRKLLFLLPGTTGHFGGGGLWAELNTCTLAQQICEAEVVTYRQREEHHPFLSDMISTVSPDSTIFVIGWGFDVPKLLKQLTSQNVIYHAHSANYGFTVPSQIPIITVSRNTMGYWGEQAAHNLIYYLPNQISDQFNNHHQSRDIDVLVQTRKSSTYLLHSLVPALQARYRVEVLESYVADLAGLFNRSKIYLYDSAEYWATRGVSEGFGLPPLEALACGCHLFSSVNHGLSDFLDPGFNCHKIAGYALEYDLQRIAQVIKLPPADQTSLLNEYRRESLITKFSEILREINQFFDSNFPVTDPIPPLSKNRIWQLKTQQLFHRAYRKLSRK